MPRFDHHIHTSRHSPDSQIDPRELIERAREVGLDGIVITEHDYQWKPRELAALAAQAGGLKVFSGAEISAVEGHFLVYGLPDLDEVPPGVTLREILEVAKVHGAAVVAAHPFRWGQDFDGIFAEHGHGLDALELVSNNVTADTRAKTRGVLDRNLGLGATGSSDAHEVEVVGCYMTEFSCPVETLADFVRGLKRRQARPRNNVNTFLFSGPVD